MGAEAAVNAVYAAKLALLPEDERAAETARLRAEYDADIDIVRLASELVIDDIVQPEALAGELDHEPGDGQPDLHLVQADPVGAVGSDSHVRRERHERPGGDGVLRGRRGPLRPSWPRARGRAPRPAT